MCSQDLRNRIESAVQEMFDANDPFTSACVSHPLISADSDVRHFEVSGEVKRMWRDQLMPNNFVRTLITVWPNGPGCTSAQAWLYHPDDFVPGDFKRGKRVLVRGAQPVVDADDAVTVSNTTDGSTVSRSCSVQTKETTLNVPRFLIKAIGWSDGQSISIEAGGSSIKISQSSTGGQTVDKEGRIRLHGTTLDQLTTKTPTAWIAEPTTGERYIEISATIMSKSDAGGADDAAPLVVDAADAAADPVPAPVGPGSVWDS